jgi:hypothetical protein
MTGPFGFPAGRGSGAWLETPNELDAARYSQNGERPVKRNIVDGLVKKDSLYHSLNSPTCSCVWITLPARIVNANDRRYVSGARNRGVAQKFAHVGIVTPNGGWLAITPS